jgi:large subunit ribosomal protein L19
MNEIVRQVSLEGTKKEVPEFEIGDTVDVHLRVTEGDKERIQVFSGVVISKKSWGKTPDSNAAFTVRRVVQGQGVERVFPVHSPYLTKVQVRKTGKVRRGKLYYMRGLAGKAARLKERHIKPQA